MLDMRLIETETDKVIQALHRRGNVQNIEMLAEAVRARKTLIGDLQALQTERNRLNDELKGANKEVIESKRSVMKQLSDKVKILEGQQREQEEKLQNVLLGIPNMPLSEVPDGVDEHGNQEVKRVLTPEVKNFPVKDHVEIGQNLGLLDVERATKMSGARFTFLRGLGSRLERALTTMMLDYHLAAGDTELSPPHLVQASALQGTGQLPKFAEDVFAVSAGYPKEAGPTPYYLIPTAEVPVTNFYADEILEEEELPKRFCAYSPCYRAEAGSAGRDTRGMIRQHQFTKVEMVRFCTPLQAKAELQNMVDRASALLTALELPHRVMQLCAGDMGFSAEMTYDLEVWLPSQNMYREISSCSSCGTFQARRAQIRYRPRSEDPQKKAKPQTLVTLNGSGLAVGRTWIALLENHQMADGRVRIPAALQRYMGGISYIVV